MREIKKTYSNGTDVTVRNKSTQLLKNDVNME